MKPLIPRPVHSETLPGVLTLSFPLAFSLHSEQDVRSDLQAALRNGGSAWALITQQTGEDHMHLALNPDTASQTGTEGYHLDITPQEGVRLTAAAPAGLFYGLQTLRQLLPAEVEKGEVLESVTLPCLRILDRPRFGWRGFMFDEARHFFGVEEVKRLLDLLARFKFNTLHWHLTDDQGWRVEIPKYPLLTEVGARRGGSQTDGFASKNVDDLPHEGFYTAQQISEVVEYARARHIRIIPEIDFPGHFSAAIAAYPELSCRSEPIEVQRRFGIHKHLACAGREETYRFMLDVLEVIAALFPGEFIHIGGDEANKTYWRTCPRCQEAIRQHGLEGENDLQVFAANRLVDCLKKMGRRALVWNDGIGDRLDEDVVMHYWLPGGKHRKNAERAIRRGKQVVVQNFFHNYFDWPHGMTPLKKTYAQDVFQGVPEENREQVLGVQGALWTEFVRRPDQIDFSIFPRLLATAEVGWTPPEGMDYSGFTRRLEATLPRLAALGVRHAPREVYAPSPLRRAGVLLRMTRRMRIEELTTDRHKP
jgi:hexosaminidase